MKNLFITCIQKIKRQLFVLSIMGIIISSHFFNEECLLTSQSYKNHPDYITNYQSGGDDGIAIGIAKYLFAFALILTALSAKFNCFILILYMIIFLLQILCLIAAKVDGLVSYWHTIMYSDDTAISFFFLFLIIYAVILSSYIFEHIKRKCRK